MNTEELKNTIQCLLEGGKGLLAMDESIATCNNRFAALHIPQTAGYRRKFRELIITAPGLEKYISGAILADETIRQFASDGQPFFKILQVKELSRESKLTGVQ
jgi:fructose-bisphosphate aldolase class I